MYILNIKYEKKKNKSKKIKNEKKKTLNLIADEPVPYASC